MSNTPSPLLAVMPPSGGGSGASSVSTGGAGSSPMFSPLYQQIKTLVLQSLQAGEWKPNEMIPSEIELAARYKISRGTVRKAIDELAAENLVARRQGKGTFVTTHYEEGVQFRFLRLMPKQGERHYPSSRILECKRMRASTEIARLLELETGSSVVQIRRIPFSSDEPTVLGEVWLPEASFRGLTAGKLTEWKDPIYTFFEAGFGVHMLRAAERIHAVATDPTTAGLLSVTAESPLLSVGRVSHTLGDKLVEIRCGLYATARHYYQNELN